MVKKIPTNVIKNAKGLAIFTTMRTGLWVSGAGGSGILIARKDDGSWSPPSGILLHTAGLGFLVGIDIYDCVIVINTEEALEAFTKIRCTLGSEISVAAGPVGTGGILDSEIHKRQTPIFTYLKSRGFYAGVQIDGTVIIERTDENERFYGQKLPVKDILAGKVRHPPYEVRRLLETIKAAQGDSDVDESILPTEAPPGDYEIDDGQVFGVPDKEDPDPYGVLALEKEGMSIKEAGTQKRASWEAFTFSPSPTSPVHNVYSRNSSDRPRSINTRRNSWRTSAFANEPKTPSSLRNSMDQQPPQTPVLMTNTSTQTDFPPNPPSPSRLSQRSNRSSIANGLNGHMREVLEHEVLDTERKEPQIASHVNGYTTPPRTPPMGEKTPEHDDDHDEDAHIEEPVVHSVQTVQTIQPASPTVVSKARLVSVPKRIPPKLPPRNPNRASGPMIIDSSLRDAPADPAVEESPESKHDSAHDPAPETDVDSRDVVKDKLDEVKLDDDADDGSMKTDPWAKVEETKKRQSQEISAMPGGFE